MRQKTETARYAGSLACYRLPPASGITGALTPPAKCAARQSEEAPDLPACKLWDYLRIFRERRFPGPHRQLIELAKSGSWRLSHAAVEALTHIDDPSMRNLGLELMSTPDRCDLGVTLLTAQSQPGDYKLIEQALRQPMSDHVYHSLGMDVLRFVKANLTGEAEASLALLYENGPCSMCRESCVKHLISLNRFPGWMRDECRYDADSGTRELAAGKTEQG